jgi:hypothetical protein
LLNVNTQLRQGFTAWRAADKSKQNQENEKALEQNEIS